MKTYPFFYALILVFAIGCSKSEDAITEEGKDEQEVEASYTVVAKKNGQLTATLLDSDAETLTISKVESGFQSTAEPQLLFEEDKALTLYQKKSDCSGTVTVHDFNSDSSQSVDVFADLGACTLTANAITKGGNKVYIAYTLEQEADTYFVRAVDMSGTEEVSVDLELEFEPIDLVFAKNRLFVFTLDEEVTGEHKMIIIDAEAENTLFTENLKLDALGIFKNPNDDIIVGYEDLHTTYNSQTLDFEFTNYPTDADPKFIGSSLRHFDSSGKMYYARVSGVHSIYERIPAVYDFDANSSVLYAYENFLTEAQREFEFEIENTTVVQYDEANNLMLVGYKKSGGTDRGGILRIKPIPEPAFAGNIDLDGVPLSIYTK
ncbi:MAG: hypothetical protein WA913_06655 [Pricia sp.]